MNARGIKWTKQYPDVKNIIVKHYNRNTKTECYRKELFTTNGWCPTGKTWSEDVDQDPLMVDQQHWGFCDLSCEKASVISTFFHQ
jgi:hypothetical protein